MQYPRKDFLYQQVKKALLAPGKRLRPCLSYYFAQELSNEKIALKPFLALEFLHNFLLIHDDIIDECTMRKGKLNTIGVAQNRYKTMVGDSEMQHFSNSLAVVAGDTLVFEVLQPIHDSNLLPRKTNCFNKGYPKGIARNLSRMVHTVPSRF